MKLPSYSISKKWIPLLIAPACLTALSAQIWDGGGATDAVSDADNWDPTGVPANDGTADIIFDGSVRTSPVFGAEWSLNSFSFAAGADSFTLGGSLLLLGGATGGILDSKLTIDSSSNQSIANAVRLTSSQTWSSTNGADLTLTGGLSLNGNDFRVDFGTGHLKLGTSGTGYISSAAGSTLTLKGGTIEGNVSARGGLDLDSAGGPNIFAITKNLYLADSSTVDMTIGASGADRIDVGSDLTLDGTLRLTNDASSPLTDSGLHTIFTYAGSLNNSRMELAGGPDFSGDPDWKFALTTGISNQVNIVASEIRDWDGGGGDGLLSTASNWDADKGLNAFDYLVIDPAANGSIDNDLAAGSYFGGIELGGTNNADLTLTGNQANLTSGIIIHGGDQTFDLDLTPNALDFESNTLQVNGGSATFNGEVTMLSGLNVKMEVADGSSVTFNGSLSGSKLFKTGTTATGGQSTVTLNGVGTFDGAAGGSSVTQGDLVLSGADGSLVLSGNPQLDLKGLPDSRARLVFDNSIDVNGNRISDNSLIAMFGNSAIKFIGNESTGVTESLTGLALFDGVTTFEMDAPAGVESGIVIGQWPTGFQRTSLNYLAVTDTSGALGTGGANPFIKFDTGIADGALIGRANYNGTDLLAYDSTNGLRAATTITTTVGAGSEDHLRLDADETLGGNLTVNSLALKGSKLDGASSLTVSSGLILGTTGSELAANTNAVGTSGVTIVDTQGDTTISGALDAAASFEKWGNGNLSLSATGEIELQGSSTNVRIEQGTVTLGQDNAISSSSSAAPNLSLRHGSTLDLGIYDNVFRTVTLEQGSLIDGSGLLTAETLSAGSIPATAGAGDLTTIQADLHLSHLYESSNSAGVLINGKTTFDGPNGNLARVTVGKDLEFVGDVDFASPTSITISGSGGKSLTFSGSVTSEDLSISSVLWNGYNPSNSVVFDGTVSASGLFIDAPGADEFSFNDTVTFSPSADIPNSIATIARGDVTLGGNDGEFSGLETLSIGNTKNVGVISPIRQQAGLTLDNSSAVNSDRIDSATLINIESGSKLSLIGNGSSNVTEVIGKLNLNAGETRLEIQNDSGASTTLQITELNRTASNVLMIDSSGGALGDGANNPNLLIDNATTGFLDRAILNGSSFTTYDGGVKDATTLNSFAGTVEATDHVRLAASETLSSPKSAGSLVVDAGVSLDGGGLSLASGHILMQEGASVSSDLSAPGNAFIYNGGSAAIGGDLAAGGDVRKAGTGNLLLGADGGSLSVGSGNTFYVDAGTVSTGGDDAIAAGSNVQVRDADLRVDHNLALADLSLNSGSNLLGSGSVSADNLIVDNSSVFSGTSFNLYTQIDTAITGATNVAIVSKGSRSSLNSSSDYTGTTTVDGNATLSLASVSGSAGGGAILGSSRIDLGMNSSGGNLDLGQITTNRIGDSTAINFYNNSSLRILEGGSGTEVVGNVTVNDGAVVKFIATGTAALSMASFTSTDAFTTLSSGNGDNFLAGSVSIDGADLSNGEIVKSVFRNNAPVTWTGGVFQEIAPYITYGSGGFTAQNFVSVTSAFNLTSDSNTEYIRFESTDPFNSTPGTTLFVQSGLFFASDGGNTMNAAVELGANGSISTSSIVRFTEVLTAADDLNVIGGGTLVIDNGATVTGLTKVREGKLVVGETNSDTTFNGDISVSGGASIGGSGTVNGDLTIAMNASTNPGNSPGLLTITGNLTYDAGSIAKFELGQINNSDIIAVDGNLEFAGPTVKLVGLDGLTAGLYTLYTYGGTLTGFELLQIDSEEGLGAVVGFDADLINDTENNAINLMINSLGSFTSTALGVPEPSSALLVMLCACGLFVRRRP